MGSSFLSKGWSLALVLNVGCLGTQADPLNPDSAFLNMSPPPPGSGCVYGPDQEKTFTYLSSRLHTGGTDPTNSLFDVDFRISSDSSSNTWSTVVSYNCKNEFETKKVFTAQYHTIVSGGCQTYGYVIPGLSQECYDYFWEALFNF